MRPGRVALMLVAGWVALEAVVVGVGSTTAFVLAPLLLVPLPVLGARALGRRFDPLEPLWLASVVFLGTYALVPVLQLADAPPFESLTGYLRLSPPHYALAGLLSGAGYLAFLAGYLGPLGRRAAAALATRRHEPSDRRLALTAAGLLLAGVLAVEATLIFAEAWTLSPAELATGGLRDAALRAGSGRGYLTLGYLAFGLGLAAVGALLARRARRGARSPWRVVAAFAVLAVTALAVFGAILGSRQLAIVTLVQLLVVAHLAYRRIPTGLVVISGAALAVAGVAFISLRNLGRVVLDPIEWVGLAAKTFDGFNFLVTALARIDSFLWGRTVVEDLVLTYLPRALVPGKPVSYGIVAAQDAVVPGLSGSVASGTYPPGILAEGYLNLGVAGLLLLPFALGLLLRVAWDWGVATRGPAALLLLGYLLGNQSGLMRGLGPVLASLFVIAVLLAPLLIAERPRARPRWRYAAPTLALGGIAAALTVAAVARPIPGVAAAVAPSSLLGGPAPRPTPELRAVLPPEARDGRTTLLAFGASWCGDCRAQWAELARAPAGARVVAVAVHDERRRAWVALGPGAEGVALVIDDGTVSAGAYGISDLPTTVVVGPDGLVGCALVGRADEAAVATALARMRREGRCAG